MRASHKKRIARLLASTPTQGEAERQEVERRERIRWRAMLCAFIRDAMERRGIDRDGAPALCAYEAETRHKAERVAFVDTPEFQIADVAFRAAHPRTDYPDAEGPRKWALAKLDRLTEAFLDGSSPDFARCSIPELWAWAIAQNALGAAENLPPAGEGSGA